MTLEKTYAPKEIEARWYQHWEKNHYFSPKKQAADSASYCKH